MRTRAERVRRRHPLIVGVERFGVDLRRYLVVRAELGLFAGVLAVVLLFVLGVPVPAAVGRARVRGQLHPQCRAYHRAHPAHDPGLPRRRPGTRPCVIAGYALINFLQDHLLQPVVMGSELNLSPLVVMISVIAWAWILGAAGALLAVPLTVGLVAILEAFPGSRGMAALLRNKVEPPPGTTPDPDPDPFTAPMD